MTLYDVVQWALVGAAVAGSALYALGKLAPGLRARCGLWLSRPARPRWLRAVGLRLAAAGGGCASGCSTCGACGPESRGDTISAKTVE